MQHPEAAAEHVLPAAEGIEQAEGAGGELHRHRVHAEVPPRKVVEDRPGPDRRQGARRRVPLGAGRHEVEAARAQSLDRRRPERGVDGEGPAERARDLTRDADRVALDDDVQVTSLRPRRPRAVDQRVPDDPAHGEGPGAGRVGQAPDLRQELEDLDRPAGPESRDEGRAGDRQAGDRRAADGADRPEPVQHEHGGGAGEQPAAHANLRIAPEHRRDRACQLDHPERVEPEGHRPRQVVREHQRPLPGEHERASAPRPQECPPPKHGGVGGTRDHAHVGEVPRARVDLRVGVGAPRRHADLRRDPARGWNWRYIRSTADDGRWV